MCPECMANAAMVAGGILSSGGIAAIGARVLGRTRKTNVTGADENETESKVNFLPAEEKRRNGNDDSDERGTRGNFAR